MGRMEEYYLWKKNELNRKMAKETIDFFKTNPTDEQLIALEHYDKKILLLVILALAVYTLFGGMIGYGLGVMAGLGV